MATRNDLVARIAKRTGGQKNEIDTMLLVAMDEIKKGIMNNESFELRGFGTFSAKERKPKVARNISKNIPVHIGPTAVPHFKPSKSFKEAVRQSYDKKIY